MVFVTKRACALSPILSAAVVELQGFRSVASATVAEAAPLVANTVGGTLLTATTTNSVAVNRVAQTASDEISVRAATHFASPAGPGSAATEVVNAHPM
jgi:hypothetical protein